MLLLITLALVATYIWFLYTRRMATLSATRYTAKASLSIVKQTARTIKLEADIAKLENDLADKTIDSKDRAIARDAIRDVADLFDSVGIDKEYYTSRKARLQELKSELAK